MKLIPQEGESKLYEQDDLYRLLFEKNPHPMWIVDRQTLAFLAVNEAAVQHYGYSLREFLSMTIKDIRPPGDIDALLKYVIKWRDEQVFEFRDAGVWKHRKKDGVLIDVEIAWSPIAFKGKNAVLVLARDITHLRQVEKALKQSQQGYEGLINSIDGIVWEADAHTFGFSFVSEQAERILGYPAEQWLHEPTFWKDHLHPDDRQRAVTSWTNVAREKKDHTLEYRMTAADGRTVWLRDLVTVVVGEHGGVQMLRGVMMDITQKKHAEERLTFLADHDHLTDLPNRLLFMDRLSQALARVKWHQRLVAVLYLDLDHFKRINDSLGHDMGDLLLKAVAERLNSCVRAGDTVARIGGDEFTIVLGDVAQAEDIPKVAQKIVDAISKPFSLMGQEFFITLSMGISVFPNDGQDAQTLVKNADAAMYRAKEQGRNHYQHYSPAMNVRTLERLALESNLRHALERKELLLHYQPRVDLETGRITGVEALLRWQYPDLGLVSPSQFIPLAEETGLIIPIGEWVLRTACAQNKLWQSMGFPPIRVAVNLSARQFEQRDLVETIDRVINETGLNPNYLELELTEGLIMKNPETTIATLRSLHKMGIQISIDDFGTGYSSLSYLRRFPIHALKIDQSFVRDIITDPDGTVIVTAIILLAHSLKLKVIAEGVETKDQLDFVRSLKCHEMQGYFFSKPLPGEEMTRLLTMEKHL
jgi:diguanylate cyclase (GGDEF)-like protein/PAS domain S-box-containing protein